VEASATAASPVVALATMGQAASRAAAPIPTAAPANQRVASTPFLPCNQLSLRTALCAGTHQRQTAGLPGCEYVGVPQ
jgi:hypothetical protein